MMDQVSDLVSYDPLTGKFAWKVSRGTKKKGAEAGTIRLDGYIAIQLNGKKIQAASIAWYLTHGYWPKLVDHINRNKQDNRLVNLREATSSQNGVNRGRTQKSGYRGVYPSNSKWIAKITVNKVPVYLGTFDTPEEAHAEYVKQSRHYNQGFSFV